MENESERLLSEYRNEHERAERLEILNRALTDRVADLETRLAVRVDGNSKNSIAGRNNRYEVPTTPQSDSWRSALRR